MQITFRIGSDPVFKIQVKNIRATKKIVSDPTYNYNKDIFH